MYFQYNLVLFQHGTCDTFQYGCWKFKSEGDGFNYLLQSQYRFLTESLFIVSIVMPK